MDLSRFNAPELNKYSFISFGGSAAIAPADIKKSPVASEPMTFEQFTRMSSSLFGCNFLADRCRLSTNSGDCAGTSVSPRQEPSMADRALSLAALRLPLE